MYRDGDRNAADASGLAILHTTVTGFKKGSELERDVTAVAGATTTTIHCQFTDKEGKVLLERDITGKVRLIGDNLKATDDFAKKAATAARDNFSSDSTSSNSKKSGYKNVISEAIFTRRFIETRALIFHGVVITKFPWRPRNLPSCFCY